MHALKIIEELSEENLPEGLTDVQMVKDILTPIIEAFKGVCLDAEKTKELFHSFPVEEGGTKDLGGQSGLLRLLLDVTELDYASFYYLRSEIRDSLYKLGAEPFDILPQEATDMCDITPAVIKYAVDFDTETIIANATKIGSLIERRDYLYKILCYSISLIQASSAYKDEIEGILLKAIQGLELRLSINSATMRLATVGKAGRYIPDEERGLLYNYWDSNYTAYQEDAQKAPSRTFEQNAILYPNINERYFIEKTSRFFSYIYENPDIASSVRERTYIEILTSLFENYITRIRSAANNNLAFMIGCARDWANITKFRIIEAHYRVIYRQKPPTNATNVERILFVDSSVVAREIQEELLQHVSHLLRSFLLDISGNPYKEIYNVIPFNFWLGDYKKRVRAIMKQHYLKPEDQKLLNYEENAKCIYDYLHHNSTSILLSMANDEDVSESLSKYGSELYTIGLDYLDRLQEYGIVNPDYQAYAFKEWIILLNTAMWEIASMSLFDLAINMHETNNTAEGRKDSIRAMAASNFQVLRVNQDVMQRLRMILTDVESRITDKDKGNGARKKSRKSSNLLSGNMDGRVGQYEESPERQALRGFVINPDNADYVMEFLDNHITHTSGVNAFVYVDALPQEKVTDRIPHSVIQAVYPNIGSDSNYDIHVGKDLKTWRTPIEPIKEEIRARVREIAAKKSANESK